MVNKVTPTVIADQDKKEDEDGKSKDPSSKTGNDPENVAEDEKGEEGPSTVVPQRDKWSSKLSYFLTLVGFAVGFGNIWRFPYQMRENGGLVFLIPYFGMLALVGIPIFFLELAVGQRRRKGTVYAWAEISPPLGGIGMAGGWICFFIALYYNTLIAYCISYLVDSFISPLPWTNCVVAAGGDKKSNLYEECSTTNGTGGRASKFYLNRRTLDMSTGYDDPGNYSWYLFLYHVIAWAAIFLILYKGTKFVGYVVYVTAILPYVVLIIFFIANLAIDPGKRWLGAYRLLQPDWHKVYQPNTWLKAGSQIFFSLGLSMGILVTFASYTEARNNCHRDAVSISLINAFTSCFASLVVFPIIGGLGHAKYEECYAQMNKLLSGNNATFTLAPLEEKYDIYFWTAAKNISELSTNKTVRVRYGYGEIEKDDKEAYFGKSKDYPDDKFVDISDPSVFDPKILSDLPFEKVLRDCSIAHEATESGAGTGFVFIAFTETVKQMPGANFWSFLFFFMFITLGIDSGFGIVEGAIAAIEDLTHLKRIHCTIIVCLISFLLAICLFPFGWGIYVLDLIDQWTANWTLLTIAVFECIAVTWFYGLAKISYDIRLMTGKKPSIYYLICWKFVTPILVVAILLGSVIEYIMNTVKSGGPKYGAYNPKHKDQEGGNVKLYIPPHVLVIGLLLLIFSISWIPLQFFLRKTNRSLIKDEALGDFPEEELRNEKNINVDKEEDQFTNMEKTIMGKKSLLSLQEQRDKTTGKGHKKEEKPEEEQQ